MLNFKQEEYFPRPGPGGAPKGPGGEGGVRPPAPLFLSASRSARSDLADEAAGRAGAEPMWRTACVAAD